MRQIFISDFDGTLSLKDFYWILIDDYIGEEGKEHYLAWKKDNKIDVTFLNKVFTWHSFNKDEHDEILGKVKLDEGIYGLLDLLEVDDVAFELLSAGFSYYIEAALKRYKLEYLKVTTNPGAFENGLFVIQPDDNAWFYSEVYGVNKETVIKRYKETYETVYFAGDSEPDFLAAVAADVRFAKDELARLLDVAGIDYYAYTCFDDITRVMKQLMKANALDY